MIITKEWLTKKNACSGGVKWFLNQKETDGIEVVKALMIDKKYQWANWLIVRLMSYNAAAQAAAYAAHAAADADKEKMQIKILEYGIKLVEVGK